MIIKFSKKAVIAITCVTIIISIFITLLCSLWIGYEYADTLECWQPDYEQIDLNTVLNKAELTEEDYEILYRQTGLTKVGVDRMLEYGETGKARIKTIQSNLFAEHTVGHEPFGPFLCTDFISKNATSVYLENGDILITSSTHFSSWRLGHAGLVTNAKNNEVLQSGVAGETSKVGYTSDFTSRINFMVLSPKTDKATKQQVADYALKNLTGIEFSSLTGLFTDKNTTAKTHCSHLVWYAYKQFGIDLDSNGGGLVTSQDMFKSPEVDIVQVFGFDLDELWKY